MEMWVEPSDLVPGNPCSTQVPWETLMSNWDRGLPALKKTTLL